LLPVNAGACGGGGAPAVLVLIDDHFLFARARAEELPPAQSLRELVMVAGDDRSLIYRYLDCEISTGSIEGSAPWQVKWSTIPFREGERLLPRPSVVKAGEAGTLALGSDSSLQEWTVIDSSIPADDLVDLFRR
jgi:hypothetical protein